MLERLKNAGEKYPRLKSELHSWARPFADCAQRPIALALSGIESQAPRFRDQCAMLDDLTGMPGWPGGGLTAIVDLPELAGYCFQAIYGAFCLDRLWMGGAVTLAFTPVNPVRREESLPLFKSPGLVGWPSSLNGDSKIAHEFVSQLFLDWAWLEDVFGGQERGHAGLCAYYMLLNIIEVGDSTGRREDIQTTKVGNLSFDVPLNFIYFPEVVQRRGYRILLQQGDQIIALWKRMKVSESALAELWPFWLRHMEAQQTRLGYYGGRAIPHRGLLSDLGLVSGAGS